MNRLSSLSRLHVLGTALVLVACAAGADAAEGVNARVGPPITVVLPTKQPTVLRGLPESTVLTVGGRTTTVGNLRSQLRIAAFRSLQPMHTLDQKSGGGAMHGIGPIGTRSIGATSATALNENPRLATSNAGVTARLQPGFVPQLITPEYCKTHAPFISGVRGKVTSGGYAVIEGGCFGDVNGTVSMTGRFDGGAVTLQVQSWTDKAITAAIPDLRGVYDQKVGMQVSRDTYVSTPEPAMFSAARETLTLPAHFITPVSCAMIWNAGFCLDGRAFHDELTSTSSATDVWQVQAPTGWVLNSLQTSPGIGSVNYTGGFDKGPPDYAQWSMAWTSGVSRTVTTSTDYGFFVTHDTDQYYGQSYAMGVTATGPVGTMPN